MQHPRRVQSRQGDADAQRGVPGVQVPGAGVLQMTARVARLKARALGAVRRVSIDQARLITESYQRTEGEPRAIRRAKAFAHACANMPVAIHPDELIVGNRTPDVRAGIVFPEAAVAWVDRELESLPTRAQDPFSVDSGVAERFRGEILPYWLDQTLEDRIYAACGPEIAAIGSVVKVNQRDHAQGHIIPNVKRWLQQGPAGMAAAVRDRLPAAHAGERPRFFESVAIAMEGAITFIDRYAVVARTAARQTRSKGRQLGLQRIAERCQRLAAGTPESFVDAVQSVWFLFVLLHLESNASSFSPGRLDQVLAPYLDADLAAGRITLPEALECVECLWVKFNEIVYMRNAHSAEFFAGFPIGFNVCIGGQTPDGRDAANTLSYLCLKAQEHLGLPQPNLSARLHAASPPEFLEACVRVIGRGSGMPQVFNDESIVPALERQGVSHADAADYGVVGCVELSPQGNCLGWSDAAMFNLVKALELAINHGRCLLTGASVGPDLGGLDTFGSYEELETAFDRQVDHFVARMADVCAQVDRIHADVLPTPFLSGVVDGCVEKGRDVTAGGARYNFSGFQGIQVANVADSLAAVKTHVFGAGEGAGVDGRGAELLAALRGNFEGRETLRQKLLRGAPKYGNDDGEVDEIGATCARRFAAKVEALTNARGGRCHAGFYTVSAHLPMGRNVGATPDGRRARQPLADGGLSAVYGRDERGPTALLKSVARIPSLYGSNGTLLNMKFLPAFFCTTGNRRTFASMLATLVRLRVHHAQFNVVRREDLLAANAEPEKYRSLTVRVAGYTAYFVELAAELRDEIIARTTYG